MKTYLNNNEMNDLLFVHHLLEINAKTVNEWLGRGNLTKDEAKYLRTAITFTEKFVTSVLKRLDQKEVIKVSKRTIRALEDPVRIVDKWAYERILGSYDTEAQIVKIERPDFEKVVLLAVKDNCKDCEKHFSECELYDILDNNFAPRADLEPNCPYCILSKEKLDIRVALEKEKEQLRKEKEEKILNKSKRKNKKHKNRYDYDDEEIIEYNFTPKIK